MRTRLLVVQPLFSVIVEESEPGPSHAECNSTGRASSPAPAGSAVLAILAALLAKVAADLPTAISGQIPALLEDLLGLITGAAAPGEEGDRGGPYAANGAILAALGNLLQKAAAALPTILPEILQLIALFGGNVNVTPGPSPATS